MFKLKSNILLLYLSVSFFESLGSMGISHIQSQSSNAVQKSQYPNEIYAVKLNKSNEAQNNDKTVNPVKNKPMKIDTIKKDVFHYIHDTAISTTAKIMKGSSEFVGLRFGIEKLVETGAYPKFAYLPPPFIFAKKEVNTLIFQKRKVWTIKPKASKKQVILYLHGGGYVANLSLVHWDFIQEIVQRTNSIVIVPDYPLSPDFTYKELFNFMDELYSWIAQAYPDCEIVFMGDSAGGGLSLAYAQFLHVQNLDMEKKTTDSQNTNETVPISAIWKVPKKIILLSPWLDLGMKNPEAKPIAELDKILSFEALNLCAQAYLGNKKPSDELLKLPQVSPIYGPILSNTEIALFIGTHDLFFADSKKLKQQYSDFARTANSAFSGFQFYEYPQMFHVWMLFTKLPESQTVIGQITEFLEKE